jgi:thiamine-phosphate pyrophosphorylase
LESHAIAMAKPQRTELRRVEPRLYLVTPPVGEADGLAAALGSAIGSADVAAVLLKLKPDGERALINRVKTLAALVQPHGAALLLDGHAEIAPRGGADGAHLTGIDAFTAESQSLRPARIAGCGGLHTRHDAMLAAERGADYVMFGEPDTAGQRPSFEAILERIEWWAEVFEIPCVAFAATPDEVGPLVKAGVDFVAIGGALWDDPRGPAAAIADIAARLMPRELVP